MLKNNSNLSKSWKANLLKKEFLQTKLKSILYPLFRLKRKNIYNQIKNKMNKQTDDVKIDVPKENIQG